MHSAERRGSLVMMGVLMILFGWVVYEQWIRPPEPVDLAPLRLEFETWMAEQRAERDAPVPEPFPFDPNTLEREGWLALGLSHRQVDGLERYTAKGGRFRVKRDLAKVYSLRPEQIERLLPFVLLPDSLPRTQRPQRERPQRKTYERVAAAPGDGPVERVTWVRAKVEVNTADSLQLVALPGIGPAFARGILRYRESLGGFLSLDQLEEVYVLKGKPDALARMKELLVVDTLMVRRIPINTCTVEELAEHPYVRWKLAKPLIAYRAQHGPFAKVEDIRGCVLVDEEVFRKLAPYLSVE